MKQSTLLKISLTCTIAGIIILFLVLQFFQMEETAISKISAEDMDKTIKISGIVSKVSENTEKGVKFLTIEKTEAIDVVVFDDKDASHFNKGDFVEVTGKVDEYKGEKEIIADEVAVKN